MGDKHKGRSRARKRKRKLYGKIQDGSPLEAETVGKQTGQSASVKLEDTLLNTMIGTC